MTNKTFTSTAYVDRGPTHTVVFVRDDMFYPLEIPISDDLAAHAECNPGTLMILDDNGTIIWRPPYIVDMDKKRMR